MRHLEVGVIPRQVELPELGQVDIDPIRSGDLRGGSDKPAIQGPLSQRCSKGQEAEAHEHSTVSDACDTWTR